MIMWRFEKGVGLVVLQTMDITKVGPAKQTKRARWQSYVDDALLKTGQVNNAAIHGLDGLRWACSTNFQVSQ